MKSTFTNSIQNFKSFSFILFLSLAILSQSFFQQNAIAQGCTTFTGGLNSANDYISRVDFGRFKNITGSSTNNPVTGISDYSATTISGRLKQGASIPIRVYVNNGLPYAITTSGFKYKVRVYIDWDGNGDFTGTYDGGSVPELFDLLWYNNPGISIFIQTNAIAGYKSECPFLGYNSCIMDMVGMIKVPSRNNALFATITAASFAIQNPKMYVSLIRENTLGNPTTFPCGNATGLGEVEVYSLTYNTITSQFLAPFSSGDDVSNSNPNLLSTNPVDVTKTPSLRITFVGINDLNATYDNNVSEDINKFTFFNMFNSDSTSLVRGLTYDFTMGIINPGIPINSGCTIKVWMDFDDNGVMDEPTELVVNRTVGANTTSTFGNDVLVRIDNTITIPALAKLGPRIMRVSLCPKDRNNPQLYNITNEYCQYMDFRVYFKDGCTGSNLVTQGNFNFASMLPAPQSSPPLGTEFSFTGYNYRRFNDGSTPKWDSWNGASWVANQSWGGQGLLTVFQKSDYAQNYYRLQASNSGLDWWGTNYYGGHGGGPYLLVNGDNLTSSKPWCQDINFPSTGFYSFSYYMANLQSPSEKFNTITNIPPRISISVDGVGQCIGSSDIPIVENISAQSTGNVWTNIRFSQNINTTGTRQVCINALVTSIFGNDFALDDISVRFCNNTAEKNAETTLTCVLHIHLLDFGGAMLNPDFIQVKWIATGEEDRTSKYMLYKSADSENWSLIQTTQAKGSGIGTSEYIYLDNTPLVGANYYKLTSIDSYGKVEEFNSIVVMNKKDMEVKKTEVYPTIISKNSPFLNLDNKNGMNSNVNISISNMQGIMVMKPNIEMKSGVNSVDVSSLFRGYYMLSIETTEGIDRVKFYIED